jgi:hypothetical protein
MKLSRIDQHIKDEPCAKQRALLGVFSSRFASVSREHQILYPIFSYSPLVGDATGLPTVARAFGRKNRNPVYKFDRVGPGLNDNRNSRSENFVRRLERDE